MYVAQNKASRNHKPESASKVATQPELLSQSLEKLVDDLKFSIRSAASNGNVHRAAANDVDFGTRAARSSVSNGTTTTKELKPKMIDSVIQICHPPVDLERTADNAICNPVKLQPSQITSSCSSCPSWL